MTHTPCFANGKETLPRSVWIPSGSFRIYRGSPVQMVQEMAGDESPTCSVKETLRKLTEGLAKNRRLIIQLPWSEPEETLSALFVYALLQERIMKPAPTA